MNSMTGNAGELLRQWRQRRRLSQLALASEADISQRHLSFLESGRSRPSREMVLHLGERLQIPLRERNMILIAAGHAPHYPHRGLDAPELSGVRRMIESVLHGHLPHPALAVDRHWMLISANSAARNLMARAAPHLLEGEVNVLRLSLHPEGLAPRILNLAEWRSHLLARLEHDIRQSADARLIALRDELAGFPFPVSTEPARSDPAREGRIAVPLRLKSDAGPLAFLSTTTVFGTATDVTLSEVTIEAFFPADDKTACAMRQFGG
ncbi:helix-turn-helix domain-containing protein [Paracoccus alkanivorans]|uniref:XRE family transcriptional regulator n=1 Tax=Paracoccus alkanivorans TaxID=2116655 RepID=A0A3M0MJF6_9RHOB|nr:helix-turn-helix domain-containing protein [Paracoccus alkanivorans]RMC37902.1 XRE family transcriptional regulator [Paracoccus alkanivorans]